MSPHITWTRILQGGIQVQDDCTATLGEDLEDKAVEGAKEFARQLLAFEEKSVEELKRCL